MNKLNKHLMPSEVTLDNIAKETFDFDIFENYKSPVELIITDFESRILDEFTIEATNQIGFNIDKDELLKALEYDRNQYGKGYADAKKKYQRPKGKWESYIDYDRFDGHDEDGLAIYRDILVYRCPFCGNKIHDWAKNYCAECGAELEVAE